MPIAAPQAAELRVLIDVSGSMRWNDPQNLRLPAVRLLSELAPADQRVGLWLFAENTEVMEPVTGVDTEWRERVAQGLQRIHSRGLFTDIEDAISNATTDWLEAGADAAEAVTERHLLLFTDGLVDLAAGPQASSASRQRLVDDWIPRLAVAGVQVHAIGLSDEIDRPLLAQLTAATDGWLETVRDAGGLQRIFLRMLEQAAPPTTVPLVDNRFLIDTAIREFTVLVFRQPEQIVRLLAPDGSVFLPSTPTTAVRWRQDQGFDLITVAQPFAGTWSIDAPSDPDNRVVVVTDLEIAAAPTPTAVDTGTPLNLRVWATDHGTPITIPDFLTLLQAQARLIPLNTPELSPARQIVLTLDTAQHQFVGQIATAGLSPGDYQLEWEIDGGTFRREQRRRLRLARPDFSIEYTVREFTEAEPQAVLEAILHWAPDTLEATRAFGYLQWTTPDGCSQLRDIAPGDLGSALAPLPLDQPGIHRLRAHISGYTSAGAPVKLTTPEVEVPVSCRQLGPAAELAAAPARRNAATDLDVFQLLLYWLVFNGLFVFIAGLGWILISTRLRRNAVG